MASRGITREDDIKEILEIIDGEIVTANRETVEVLNRIKSEVKKLLPGAIEWKEKIINGIRIEVIEGWPKDSRYPYSGSLIKS